MKFPLRKLSVPGRSSSIVPALFASLLLTLSCSSGGKEDGDTDSGGGEIINSDIVSFGLSTDSNGLARSSFTLPGSASKFSAVIQSNYGSVRFEELRDSRNNDYLSPGGQSLSLAEEYLARANSVTAPSREADPGVSSERPFTLSVRALDSSGRSPQSNSDLDLTILSRADSNLSSGVLKVNVFYVGDIPQEDNYRQAVGSALAVFAQIYAAGARIGLEISERSISGPSVLPNPFYGSDFYTSAASLADFPAVNLFIGGDVDSGIGSVLGLAGAIAGPAFPTIRSGVAISIVNGAGSDGVYDNNNIQLLGETMAHEVGHFLGLFHPIDFDGSSVNNSDPLSDTPTCKNQSNCEGNLSLASNLMYPLPVSNGSGGLLSQRFLTSQQAGVLNRYIAVD